MATSAGWLAGFRGVRILGFRGFPPPFPFGQVPSVSAACWGLCFGSFGFR